MTRRIKERLTFVGILEAMAPVHVGGGFDDPETDLPLAVNGRGQYYIPGTAIAGVLRQWCQRIHGDQAVREIFGFTPRDQDEGHASYILVEDAFLRAGDEESGGGAVHVHVRDGVGINRFSGTAASNIKYDRQVLPRGTRFDFTLVLEIPETVPSGRSTQSVETAVDADAWRRCAAEMIHTLMEGRLRFGAAKSRGLGRMRLKDVQVRTDTLLSRAGMLDLLSARVKSRQSAREAPVNGKDFKTVFPDIRSVDDEDTFHVAVHWRPVQPIMVKAEAEGLAVDMLPLFSPDVATGKAARVIPGSAIKGALRATAERIMNTLFPPKGQDFSEDEFLKQLDVHDLVRLLFGTRGRSQQEGDAAHEGLSSLFVDDCHCEDSDNLDLSQWKRLFAAKESDDLKTVIDGREWHPAMHVAIDRFTGGAAERFLYSILEPFDGRWEPLHLELDLRRLPESKREAAKALLLLVLREMVQQRLPLGFGTHRGMGAIEVTAIEFGEETLDPQILDGRTDAPAWIRELDQAWRDFCRQRPGAGAA